MHPGSASRQQYWTHSILYSRHFQNGNIHFLWMPEETCEKSERFALSRVIFAFKFRHISNSFGRSMSRYESGMTDTASHLWGCTFLCVGLKEILVNLLKCARQHAPKTLPLVWISRRKDTEETQKATFHPSKINSTFLFFPTRLPLLLLT